MTRQRHTFLVEFDENTKDDDKFKSEKNRFVVTNWDVPLHSRITIPFDELAEELQSKLRGRQFQVSYSTKNNHDQEKVPFRTAKENGLRIESTGDWDGISDVLTDLIGGYTVDEKIYIDTPNWRSIQKPELHEWSGNSLVARNVPYANFADSVFINYGSLPITPNNNQKPNDLVIEAYWSAESRQKLHHQRKVEELVFEKPARGSKVEIGLLKAEYNRDDGDYRVSGLIRDMDKKQFDKTLFFASPKLKPTDSTFTASFHQPIGLHPRHELAFNNLYVPQDDEAGLCKLYAKYNVPSSLFLDKYQLEDLNKDAGTPPTGKLIGVWGESDLEEPVWKIQGWGSESLIQIYYPTEKFDLTMHSRYEVPTNDTTVTHFHGELASPLVFWACREREAKPSPEFKSLGYESLFPDDTVFYQVAPSYGSETTEFSIPIAPQGSYETVRLLTVVIILGGFFYLCGKILTNVFRESNESVKHKEKKNA